MSDTADSGAAGGIQSLDAALRVLAELSARGGAASLSDLARACAMPPSKVHRYLTSFAHAGLVEQAERSGKYALGAGALELGLMAMARHDFVDRAAARMPALAEETGMTVLLSIWGGMGATVVRWERAAAPMVTSMGLGTVLPLLNSATGRTFLAWAPRAPLADTLARETAQARKNPALLPDATPDALDSLIAMTRQRGFARIDGLFIPGLAAVAAPVLDWQGQAQAVLTLITTDPAALADTAPALKLLAETCRTLSFRGAVSPS